jgi:hypothetical protein
MATVFRVIEATGQSRARTFFARESEAAELATLLVGEGATLVLIETWRDGRREDLRLIRPAGSAVDRLADD